MNMLAASILALGGVGANIGGKLSAPKKEAKSTKVFTGVKSGLVYDPNYTSTTTATANMGTMAAQEEIQTRHDLAFDRAKRLAKVAKEVE